MPRWGVNTKNVSVEHYAWGLLATVISENQRDHLLSCYCASRTLREFLELVVIRTTWWGFCSHFTDRETKVLPSYLVICCNSRPRLVLTSSPSLFVHVYWLISLFLQCGVKNRFPVISTRELAPCHFLFVFFQSVTSIATVRHTLLAVRGIRWWFPTGICCILSHCRILSLTIIFISFYNRDLEKRLFLGLSFSSVLVFPSWDFLPSPVTSLELLSDSLEAQRGRCSE